MKHKKLKKIKVDINTGEVYMAYPRRNKTNKGLLNKAVSWIIQRYENHIDRLIEMRVYADRRFDISGKK